MLIENPKVDETWINVKNRVAYTVVQIVTDATNGREGMPMVLYVAIGEQTGTYVRDLTEFKQKFVKQGTSF